MTLEVGEHLSVHDINRMVHIYKDCSFYIKGRRVLAEFKEHKNDKTIIHSFSREVKDTQNYYFIGTKITNREQ